MEKIPESFPSVQHYLEAYVFPLLEETRAELSSSMELISGAPFAVVVSFEESKPLGSLFYDIRIDYWRNGSCKEPYRTLPGDVFVISEVKPATVCELEKSERTWTLAWVPHIPENGSSMNLEGCTANSLKFKVAKEIGFKDSLPKSLNVVFLMNIITYNRIWNSLHLSTNANVIKEVLSPNAKVRNVQEFVYFV